jgi:hypothetical protein
MLKTGIHFACIFNYITNNDFLTSESDARKFLRCEQMKQMGIAVTLLQNNGFTIDRIVTNENIKAMVNSVVGVKRKSIVGKCKNFFMGKTLKSNAEMRNALRQCTLNSNGNNSNGNNMEGGKRKTRRHKKRKTIRRRKQ